MMHSGFHDDLRRMYLNVFSRIPAHILPDDGSGIHATVGFCVPGTPAVSQSGSPLCGRGRGRAWGGEAVGIIRELHL